MRNVGTGANGKAGKYEEKSPARESRYGTWRLAMRSQIDVSICMKWTKGTSNEAETPEGEECLDGHAAEV